MKNKDKTVYILIAKSELRTAYWYSREHSRVAQEAIDKYGYHGPLISGVIQEHFPEEIKEYLRYLAYSVGGMLESSRGHWLRSGRRLNTWIKEKDKVIAKEGKGYYG